MTECVSITYRDFWDVPRIFFTSHGGQLYLFDCQFDESGEDYPNEYQVFQMPPLTDADYAGSWADLWHKAIRKLGNIPIPAIRFDTTRRKSIGTEVFDLIPQPAAPSNGVGRHVAAPTGTTEPAA